MPKKIPFLSISDLVTKPKPPMLIEGILPQRGLMMLQSHSGVGKTWFALELGISIATATPAFGRFVVNDPGKVWYICEDAPDWDLGAQFKKLISKKGLNPDDFDKDVEVDAEGNEDPASGPRFYPTVNAGLYWDDAEWTAAAVEFVKAHGIKLVIVDTLAETNRQDENDNSAMKMVAKRLKLLRESGATVLVLHHKSKPREGGAAGGSFGTTGARGASSFGAACDGALELRPRMGRVEVVIAKQRAMRLVEFKYALIADDDEAVLEIVEEKAEATTLLLSRLVGAGNAGLERAAMLSILKGASPGVGEAALAQRWWQSMQRLISEGKVKKLRRGVYGATSLAVLPLAGAGGAGNLDALLD